MNNALFDRIVVLTVADVEVRLDTNSGTKLEPTGEIRTFPSRMQDGLAGFRIRFKCEKTIDSTPNKATVSIYNLNPDSRSAVEREGSILTLQAGYGDSVETVFEGNIAKGVTVKDGADYITEIEIGDGLSAFQNSTLDQSFKPGTQVRDVVRTLTQAFGVSQGEQRPIPTQVLNNGIVVSGPVRDSLTKILDRLGLKWSIQNNQLQILDDGGSTDEEVILLSPNSGMVGIPKKREQGIECVSLLRPSINPGRRFKLESKFVNGIYIAEKVTHEGDSHSGNFLSSIEAKDND